MIPKTLLDTDVLSGLMRKSATALDRARSYLADHPQLTMQRIMSVTLVGFREFKSTIGLPEHGAEQSGPAEWSAVG